MTRCLLLVALAALSTPAAAQERLTLADAIEKARASNPAVRAAIAAEAEAGMRLRQAQGAWLPRVDFVEGVQRGNMPVYVFGSLLAQRRFSAANFAVDALNHPAALTNHRAAVTVEQPVFSSEVETGVRSARIASDLAVVGRDATDRDLAVETTVAYGRALSASAALRASQAAVAAAEEDARRARDRRAAGVVTEADVLALEVHLAQVRAKAIEADADRRVALAALNRAMGEALDREYLLELPPPPAASTDVLTALEALAVKTRPEARRAALQQDLARVQQQGARRAFLPQVGWQSGYEWNGADFSDRTGGWIVGAELRVNVFHGLIDRARLSETAHAFERAVAERASAESAIRLEVRRAWLHLEAARARVNVGATAVSQARESHRILVDRYDTGLVGVGDVLRAAQAMLDAELQHTAAQVDVITAAAALDRAVGR
ncbi:MAG TPA: TolC family protein [Vicinamibacterales bacterium]|nr:TolC family protein [Vicinamibacterales bacterium]